MKTQGWRAKAARKYKATTNSNHNLPVAPNLLAQDFEASAPDQKWVSDISYIWTVEGWLYLAVVLELYSRKVVGRAMAERMTASLVCDALTMGTVATKITKGRDHSLGSRQPILLDDLPTLAQKTPISLQHE